MKAVWRLAGLPAWSRRLTLGLTHNAIALAVTLLLAVEEVHLRLGLLEEEDQEDDHLIEDNKKKTKSPAHEVRRAFD